MTAARPGEFEIIARHFAPVSGRAGLGLIDDAAVMSPPAGHDLVVTKDMLVAGVHFFPDDPPETLARKALRVNLSDLAAKGAQPLGFLLGLGLPQGWTEAWIAAFAASLGEDARRYACPLIGGDTVRTGERLTLSITAFGSVPAGTMVRRSTGRPGDALYVSGVIGAAALGLLLHPNQPDVPAYVDLMPLQVRMAAEKAYLEPDPAAELAETLRLHARAAMDISDGLIGDAAKLAAASGCGFQIEAGDVPLPPGVADLAARVPAIREICLTGGDDYQILAAVAPERCAAFEAAAAGAGRPVHRIGALTADGMTVLGADGRAVAFSRASFAHF